MLDGFKNILNNIFKNQKEISQQSVGGHLKELLEIIAIYYWWKDKNGIYLGCNKKVAKLLGLKSEEDLVGKTDYELPWSDHAKDLVEHDNLVMSSKKIQTREEVVTDKNGNPHTFMVTKSPLVNANGDIIGTIGTSIEITELKNTQKQLSEEKIKAEEANKAKTEFLYNMRHDIRTPFSGILSLTQHMADKETDPDKKEKLTEIAKAADIFLVYLNEILEFTQIESGKAPVVFKTFNLKQSIYDLIQGFNPSVELKSVELIFNYHDAPEWVIGDQFRIQRILVNLLSNAVKFTEKGSITVEVKEIEREKRHCVLSLSVSDTGMGIPKEKENVIFERFTKLDTSYRHNTSGMGLGLQAVKSLIDDLEGDIALKSAVNKGSSFICMIPFKIPVTTNTDVLSQISEKIIENTLPITTRTQESLTLTEASSKHNEQMLLRVLLVEDNRIAQLAASNLLEDAGFTVDIVATGEKALEQYQSHPYDLILLDIGLPDMDGYTVAKKIRVAAKEKNKSDIPIIILTAHSEIKHVDVEFFDKIFVKPLTKVMVKKLKDEYAGKNAASNIKTIDVLLIDWNALMTLHSDIESAKNILALFIEHIPDYVNSLNNNIDNTEILQKIIHKISDEAHYCCIQKLVSACDELTKAIADQDKSAIQSGVFAVMHLLNRLNKF